MTRPLTTHCPKGHEKTPENTLIRGNGKKECGPCKRDRERERRATRDRSTVAKGWRRKSAPGETAKALAAASPITLAQWRAGWIQWEKYRDANEITLADERIEALLRLAYRYPQEYSDLLREVQMIHAD